MTYNALLTVDITSAGESKRSDFYTALVTRSWVKLDKLTTAWSKAFFTSDEVNALALARADVQAAANGTVGQSFWAAIQVGQGQISPF
jgi:hypothetical protein